MDVCGSVNTFFDDALLDGCLWDKNWEKQKLQFSAVQKNRAVVGSPGSTAGCNPRCLWRFHACHSVLACPGISKSGYTLCDCPLCQVAKSTRVYSSRAVLLIYFFQNSISYGLWKAKKLAALRICYAQHVSWSEKGRVWRVITPTGTVVTANCYWQRPSKTCIVHSILYLRSWAFCRVEGDRAWPIRAVERRESEQRRRPAHMQTGNMTRSRKTDWGTCFW